jgi:hypothetical protein
MPDRFNPPNPQRGASRGAANSNDARVHLEVTRGRTRYRLRPVQAPAFLIGAAADCDLVLGDRSFPEVHACLLLQRDEVAIRHLGFAPGLLVNGAPVGRAALAHGDTIEAGPYAFRLLLSPPEGDRPREGSSRPGDHEPPASDGESRFARRRNTSSIVGPPLELDELGAWLPAETAARAGSDLAVDLGCLQAGPSHVARRFGAL